MYGLSLLRILADISLFRLEAHIENTWLTFIE
jgi:hypothetical protein